MQMIEREPVVAGLQLHPPITAAPMTTTSNGDPDTETSVPCYLRSRQYRR